jgi:tetratricopeptide (TPR) repeat protein
MNMNTATLEERLELARQKSGSNLDCQVIELLKPYLGAWPQDGQAWLLLGEALRGVGRYTEAAESLKKALALSPDRERSRIWCALGRLYQKSISPGEAKPWFDLATREDPAPNAWVLRGENLLLLQEYPEAIRCFTHATALDSENYQEAVLGLARAYRAMQDYAKAVRCAQQVLRKNAASTDAQRLIDELSPLLPRTLETA